MDPVSKAVTDLQQAFRDFSADDGKRLFIIETEAEHISAIEKIVRGEEWHPSNRSPFLILTAAYRDAEECFTQMRLLALEHHKVLRDGLMKDGTDIPSIEDDEDKAAYERLIHVLESFRQSLPDFMDPPQLAWFPTEVNDNWTSALLALCKALEKMQYRFAVTVANKSTLTSVLLELDWEPVVHRYEINQDEASDYMAKLMGEPALGRAKGTLPGCAAPDVEPPPRPGPPAPDPELVAATRKEANLPPNLTAEQGEALRRHVFLAARASGKQDKETAYAEQKAAISICKEAGTGQEETLMTMVLASYQLQFSDHMGAEETYQAADQLACQNQAFPQLAQIRMALGCLQLGQKRYREAAETYEQAAWAGCLAQSGMLTLESLRLAGTAWTQAKERAFAAWNWQAALDKAVLMSTAEREATLYRDLAARLTELYRLNGYDAKANAVIHQLAVLDGQAEATA